MLGLLVRGMDLVTGIVVVMVSISAGILGSLLGLGGGFIIVPALAFMGIEPSRIAGTSMFTVLSTSTSSTISYAMQGRGSGRRGEGEEKEGGEGGSDVGGDGDESMGEGDGSNDSRRKGMGGGMSRIDYATALGLAVFASPGAVLGAYSSSLLDLSSFKLYFALLLVGVAVHILMRPYYHIGGERYPRQISYAVSFFSGFVASLFGVGGGAILVPMMLMVLRMDMHVTVPTVHLIIVVSSISGVITHVMLGHPEYMLAAVLVGGTFMGAQIGSRLLGRIRDRLLRRLVAIAMIMVAARLIYDSVMG
ncbi:MAG: sulfite exporter TauE/SafE family protein [Candidatus Nitrosocaldus sp.]|nr:sulfite exporter TauE/SafE family protein [Candidatus Nitrosocaldus sp.]MDW7999546.1 sulfite exporter TauE/SafE family protein [Candidatus Nitrosocaldus sp.]